MIGLTAEVYCCFRLSLSLAGQEGIGIQVYLFGGKLLLTFLFNVYKRFVIFVTFLRF